MKDTSRKDLRLGGRQVVGWKGVHLASSQGDGQKVERSHTQSHGLVWVSWCLTSFDRWLKAFPQAVQS